MESISTTVWQRKGSSFIFDQKSLGPLISAGAVISLRQVLAWSKGLPAIPPVPGRTILVSGLETVIETMMPQAAADFLGRRIRPLLIDLQNRWTDLRKNGTPLDDIGLLIAGTATRTFFP